MTFVRDELLELINLERFGCREFEPYNISQIFQCGKFLLMKKRLLILVVMFLILRVFLKSLPTDSRFVFNCINDFMKVRLDNPDNAFCLSEIFGS